MYALVYPFCSIKSFLSIVRIYSISSLILSFFRDAIRLDLRNFVFLANIIQYFLLGDGSRLQETFSSSKMFYNFHRENRYLVLAQFYQQIVYFVHFEVLFFFFLKLLILYFNCLQAFVREYLHCFLKSEYPLLH